MLEVTGFIFSFAAVCLSSAFFTFLLRETKISHNAVYFALIFISQLIVTFQALSLLKGINPPGILICNVLILLIAVGIWLFNGRPMPVMTGIPGILPRLAGVIGSDKALLALTVLFGFCSLITLFFVILVPTNSMDALTYKLARIGIWAQQQSLAHFETTSMRQVIFPVNWELMLLWPVIFLKRDYLTVFPAFFSYFGSLAVVSIFLKSLKFSTKRIIWVILVLGSLPVMILESSSIQSDLFIGFLLFCSFYLFYFSVKNRDRKAMIFSAVAYAVTLGAKSTAILFILPFLVVFLAMSLKEKGKKFYKPLSSFSMYLIIGFLALSAYNYVLNYLSFGNIFGPSSTIGQHISPGLKSFIPSFILYMVYLLDFSGLAAIKSINPDILNGISYFLGLLGYKLSDGVCIGEFSGLNHLFQENFSSFGLLSYLLILPLTVFSLFKCRHNKDRHFYPAVSGLFLLVFLLVLILAMGFSVWCIRYFATAVILSSPVLAFSYFKKTNLLKILITILVALNYTLIPFLNVQKPLPEVLKLAFKIKSFNNFRQDLRLRMDTDFYSRYKLYYLLQNLQMIPDNAVIGLIFSEYDPVYPFFEENPGWKIYPVRYETFLSEKSFDKYDYLIMAGVRQNICPVKEEVKFNYYPDYKNKTIHFNKNEEGKAKTFYANRDNIIIFSGKPSKMSNILDDKLILKYFKPVKVINLKTDGKYGKGLYRVYKKL